MIIRKDTTSKTATRSPLNSRSVRRTCGQREAMESTLKACPIYGVGRLFQSRYYQYAWYAGVLATLVPTAIER